MMHINASSTIKGSGTIDKAEIEANHASIETKPDSILIYKGYIANIGGEAIEGLCSWHGRYPNSYTY